MCTVKNKINLIYEQIEKSKQIKKYDIDKEFILEYMKKYIEHRYNIFDFVLVKFCKENNIKYLVTDDSDFMFTLENVKDISTITANRKYRV